MGACFSRQSVASVNNHSDNDHGVYINWNVNNTSAGYVVRSSILVHNLIVGSVAGSSDHITELSNEPNLPPITESNSDVTEPLPTSIEDASSKLDLPCNVHYQGDDVYGTNSSDSDEWGSTTPTNVSIDLGEVPTQYHFVSFGVPVVGGVVGLDEASI